VRSTAAAAYILTTAWIAKSALQARWSRAVTGLLLFSSLYPFVWLSSELIAGALLNLVLCAMLVTRSRQQPLFVGALLAMAKPDLPLTAAALLIAHALREPGGGPRCRLVAAFGAGVLVLLLPGLVQDGHAYLLDATRSWASFGQLTSILFAGRWMPADWQVDTSRYFPCAQSVLDAIVMHPVQYLSYLGRSAGRGVDAVLIAFAQLVILFPICAAWSALRKGTLSGIAKLLVVAIVGVVPWILFAYPHIRYMARYFRATVIVFCQVMEAAGSSSRGLARRATIALFLLASSLYVARGLGVVDASLVTSGALIEGLQGAIRLCVRTL
jgi:hypothetical protein